MNAVRAYVDSFFHGLIFKLVLMFVLTTAVAGAVLYAVSLGFILPESYGRAIAEISRYKLQIIRNGSYIYALYSLLVLMGVVIISIVYSYRVARPFQKIKSFAKDMSIGNGRADIRFLPNDNFHPLSEVINKTFLNDRARRVKLLEGVQALREDALGLETAIMDGNKEELEKIFDSLSTKAEDIEMILSEVKL